MKASIGFFALASCLLAACSGTTEYVGPADETTDSSSADLSTCKESKCGPGLEMPTLLCPDGSIGGNTGRCIREKGGACHWEIRECPPVKPPPPPPACKSDADCPGLGIALCKPCTDGSCAQNRCVNGACELACAPPPETKCGTKVCSATQTCCEGMPFKEPTCIEGTMCPISQRKHKKDISYLSSVDEQRMNDELLGFRLATYRYKSETSQDREHLGFIIDDVAPSPAVMASGERVDMYGYQTMTVAALHVQAREIAELRRQVEELRAQKKR